MLSRLDTKSFMPKIKQKIVKSRKIEILKNEPRVERTNIEIKIRKRKEEKIKITKDKVI